MTGFCQLMLHFMRNPASRWLLPVPLTDAVFQSWSFELQLVPSVFDQMPNLPHSHLACRCWNTLSPTTLLPSTCPVFAWQPPHKPQYHVGLLAGHSWSQEPSNRMNALKEMSLQSQMCSSHPIPKCGVCCATEDAALWGSCLLVHKESS